MGGRLLRLSLAAVVTLLSSISGIAVADSTAADGPCSTGTAVANPGDNPLLVQDCNVLLAARDTLSGGGRRLIWTADTPMSKWDGIAIGGSPARVTELRIRGDDVNGLLRGSIPPELGRLTGLVILDLGSNALGGRIPGELGGLKALVKMNLQVNRLTGSVPADLGRLTDLDYLNLSSNALTGEIPPQLAGLVQLRRLDLHYNNLSGAIPAALGRLVNLQYLIMYNNGLAGEIPRELGGLANLRWLQLTSNRLSGRIPAELGQLARLQVLDLNDNRLNGNIPRELTGLTELTTLSLSRNDLTGHIPAEVSKLTGLETLDLSQNNLTGHIPAELGKLTGLRKLILSRNRLSRRIPAMLGQLTNLMALWLDENELTGEIPTALGALTKLNFLSLSTNQLSGEVPDVLGQLTDLRLLHLNNNRLTGEIPKALGFLTNLEYLSLDNNRLTGDIPVELGRLTNLRALALHENWLTGEVPSTLGELVNLGGFSVEGNDLTGCLPLSFTRLDRGISVNPGLRFCFAADDDPATVSSAASLTLLEGGTLTIDESVLLANDLETANSTLRITQVSDAVNGKVLVVGPTITYGHDGSEATSGGFVYTVSDAVYADTAFVTLAVTPVNDPPVAVRDHAATDEGATLSIAVAELLANDTDAENDTLTISSVADAVNGTVSLDGATIAYRHDGSETTAGSFAYTVSDGTDTATAMVAISVTPVNDPPVAIRDGATLDEGGTLSVAASTLLANDSDAENDTLAVSAVGGAVNGTVSLDGATIIYRHDGSETTAGSFTYTVSDGTDTATAMVAVSVTPVNDPPVAAGDAAKVDEGGTISLTASTLLANDTDAENDTLTVSAVGDAVNGTVFLDGTTIIYRHDGSETTAGSFSYTVSDGTDTATAMVAASVTPVNDPPVAAGDAAKVDERGTLSLTASALLANDTDAENDTLTVSAVGDAVNGAVSLVGAKITYEHDGSETTTGSFTYTVTDGADTASAMVTITVSPVNDPPEAVDDSETVDEGATLSIDPRVLLANDTDADGDSLEIVAVGNARNGAVSLDGTTITYRHDGSETFMGGFAYTVSDGNDTATAVVSITVAPVNDPPVAAGDSISVDEGGTLSVQASTLLANDFDAENNTLEILAVGDAANGAASLDGTTITYEHDGSETTAGGFIYTVSDGTDTATAVVAITVSPVNDPPVAAGDGATVDEGGTLSIEASTLLANDTDAENGTLRVSTVSNAVNGAVSLDGATITYKHDGSETVTGGFSYTVTDGTDDATAMVTISVNPVSDVPVVPLIALVIVAGLAAVAVTLFVIRTRSTREPASTP